MINQIEYSNNEIIDLFVETLHETFETVWDVT